MNSMDPHVPALPSLLPEGDGSTPEAPGHEAGVDVTAGGMLKAAREAQGMSLDVLAALLKVPVPKLEALEADRHDDLPGLAFVRALAQTVCRQLNIEAPPVLARLPQANASSQPLESIHRGLATPFREPMHRRFRGARWLPDDLPGWLRPAVLIPALLILLALAFWFMPTGRALLGSVDVPAAVSDAASAASGLGAVLEGRVSEAASVVETVHSAPQEDEAGSGPQSAAAAGAVVLRARAESWVEVRDGAGGVLLSRMLLPGEAVGVDGSFPLRLKIGNAEGTQLSFRNQPIDLAPYTRDNIARLELK